MSNIRFKKHIKLCSLVTLNLNKKSVSLSVGVPGFGCTITGRKVFYHIGMPGTGLSYSGFHSTKKDSGGPRDKRKRKSQAG